MTWVLLIGAAWLTIAALVGVLIGRSIRLADRKKEENAAAAAESPNFVVDLSPPAAAGAGSFPSTDAASQPRTPDSGRPSIPPARTSTGAQSLSAEPPRKPGTV